MMMNILLLFKGNEKANKCFLHSALSEREREREERERQRERIFCWVKY